MITLGVIMTYIDDYTSKNMYPSLHLKLIAHKNCTYVIKNKFPEL